MVFSQYTIQMPAGVLWKIGGYWPPLIVATVRKSMPHYLQANVRRWALSNNYIVAHVQPSFRPCLGLFRHLQNGSSKNIRDLINRVMVRIHWFSHIL